MVGRIINPTTNETMVSKIRCPWKVVKENKGNFTNVSIRDLIIYREIVLTTDKGYQLRFSSRFTQEQLEQIFAESI